MKKCATGWKKRGQLDTSMIGLHSIELRGTNNKSTKASKRIN